jgi:hypothetical protein
MFLSPPHMNDHVDLESFRVLTGDEIPKYELQS